jgi:REP element-mobilizing transposase RayT
MKRSDFNSTEAYKIYANYIEHVHNIISALPKDDVLDIMNEFDSHIYRLQQTVTSNQ